VWGEERSKQGGEPFREADDRKRRVGRGGGEKTQTVDASEKKSHDGERLYGESRTHLSSRGEKRKLDAKPRGENQVEVDEKGKMRKRRRAIVRELTVGKGSPKGKRESRKSLGGRFADGVAIGGIRHDCWETTGKTRLSAVRGAMSI